MGWENLSKQPPPAMQKKSRKKKRKQHTKKKKKKKKPKRQKKQQTSICSAEASGPICLDGKNLRKEVEVYNETSIV